LLWNSTDGVNSTTYTTAIRTINWTGLPDETYTYNVTVCDIVNYCNTTDTYTITIDITPPAIEIVYPLNNTNTTNKNIDVNYTVINDNGVLCKWSNDSGASNKSITCGDNVTGQTWDEGSNAVIIWANDSIGNENSSSVTFTLDTTAPVISSISSSVTISSAVITWTTDENANSSVNYGLSASLGSYNSSSSLTMSHSISLLGLSSSTLYYYNVTSCDSAGNCKTNGTYSFTTSTPEEPEEGVAGGGGITCTSDWICGSWSVCADEIQTRTCLDENNCGTSAGKPEENRTCVSEEPEEEEEPEELVGELPSVRPGAKEDCISDWQCKEWSKCRVVYTFDDIIEGEVLFEGQQKRICKDKNKCFYNKIERQECDTRIPVIVKKVISCFKEYLEIYDLNETLISRLEFIDGDFRKLNIQLLLTGEYCPYCYDGIKNYDEDEIDCVYTKEGSCPVCKEELEEEIEKIQKKAEQLEEIEEEEKIREEEINISVVNVTEVNITIPEENVTEAEEMEEEIEEAKEEFPELRPFPPILIILIVLILLCFLLIVLYLILSRKNRKRTKKI